MSALKGEAEAFAETPAQPIGRLVAVSGRRVLVASNVHSDRRIDVAPGQIVTVAGEPVVLAVVSGFHSPTPDAEPFADEVVLIEALLCGRIERDGFSSRRLAGVSLGASVYPFEEAREAERRRGEMITPAVLGTLSDGEELALAGERVLGTVTSFEGGRGSGRSASVAVLLRALLRRGFPARIVLLDTDNVFTHSFGGAAELVDGRGPLAPLWMLTAGEISDLVRASGQQVTAAETEALGEILRSSAEESGTFRLSDVIGHCRYRSDEGGIGNGVYGEVARKLSRAARDERLASFFGDAADALSAEDVLQTVFRLPHGRPPMAVVQLGRLDAPVRRAAASIIMRLAQLVVESTDGAVPVLMAIDRLDAGAAEAFPGLERGVRPGLGLAIVSEAAIEAASVRVIHRGANRGWIDEAVADQRLRELYACELAGLAPGEAILLDEEALVPRTFRVTELPERALPGRGDAKADPRRLNRDEIIGAIAASWRGAPLS